MPHKQSSTLMVEQLLRANDNKNLKVLDYWSFIRDSLRSVDFIHHDDVMKWKHFPRYGPLIGEYTGPGEFPAQRPVTRSFEVFFDLRLNKRLGKQSWGWWFEMPSFPLWRHCNHKWWKIQKAFPCHDVGVIWRLVCNKQKMINRQLNYFFNCSADIVKSDLYRSRWKYLCSIIGYRRRCRLIRPSRCTDHRFWKA